MKCPFKRPAKKRVQPAKTRKPKECKHNYFDNKEEKSYGTMYFWKECLDCGRQFDHHCRQDW